jgi:signal transduction histidine kinase
MPLYALAERAATLVPRRGRAGHLDLQEAFILLRWLMIALLLLLALAFPVTGWANLPSWYFIVIYAVYSLITGLLRRRWRLLRSPAVLLSLDVLVAALLYVLGQDPDGPLYALFFLAVLAAAAVLPPRWVVFYVAVVAVVNIIAELSIRQMDPLNEVILDASIRTIVDVFVAVGAVVVVRLLRTEQEAAWRAREEAAQLANLDRLRESFVSVTSHELQTPLTAVRAGLGLLQTSAGDRLRHDEGQLLTNARRNIDRLGLQINDLLSFNQLQAERFEVSLAPFDLRAVISNVVALTQPLVEQKGQVLHVAVDKSLMVLGDQRYLEQALVNLVANAHRHTPPGTRIAIDGRETPAGILVQVEDDGPGIPDHARHLLFERFTRLDPSTAGSGLGLTIVKAVVERHGGRIWYESAPGHGASFFVLLPQAA